MMPGKGTVYISRKVRFSSAHRMFNPELSDKENMDFYGKCASPGGHGHNYVLEVTVRGVPDKITGIVTDLGKLDTLLQDEVVRRLDNKDLNADVEILKGMVPSMENIVRTIWDVLEPGISGCELYEIRIWETDNNCAWYRGGV